MQYICIYLFLFVSCLFVHLLIILCPNFHTALLGCCVKICVCVFFSLLYIIYIYFLSSSSSVCRLCKPSNASRFAPSTWCMLLRPPRKNANETLVRRSKSYAVLVCVYVRGIAWFGPLLAGVWVARGGGRAHKRIQNSTPKLSQRRPSEDYHKMTRCSRAVPLFCRVFSSWLGLYIQWIENSGATTTKERRATAADRPRWIDSHDMLQSNRLYTRFPVQSDLTIMRIKAGKSRKIEKFSFFK